MFDHYRVMFYESRNRYYYIHSLGDASFVLKSELNQEGRMNESLLHKIEPRTITRNGRPLQVIVVGKKMYTLKKLVAKTFIKSFDHQFIYHKDNNYLNCCVENLLLVETNRIKSQLAKRLKSKRVVCLFLDGSKQTHESITAAAKSLHCYPDTIVNFANGKTKTSCIESLVHTIKIE